MNITIVNTILNIGIACLAGMLIGRFWLAYEQRYILVRLKDDLEQCVRHRAAISQMLSEIHAWGEQNIPAFTKIMGETERQANDCRGEAKECARLLREILEKGRREI